MAEDGQLGGFAREAEPTAEDLLDPIALEARLKEARARRAEVLARRGAGQPADPVAGDRPQARAATIPFPSPFPSKPPAPCAAPGFFDPPAARVRPVLIETRKAEPQPSRLSRGEHPPFVAPAIAADAGEVAPELVAMPPAAPAAARRLPRAVVLFVAGLGLGAAAVAVAVRPADEPPTTVASAPETSAPAPATAPPAGPAAEAPAPVAAPEAEAPAEVLASPRAPRETAAAPRPVTAPPAVLAAPASEPAPPAMAPPDAAIGTLVAAAPEAPEATSPPQTATAPEAQMESAPEAETAADAEPPAAVPAVEAASLPQRVSIHYPRSAEAVATSVQAALRAAGVADVETMPVGFAIGSSNVRYYHDSDRAGAEGASAVLADALDGAPQTRDFTDYPTPTAVGKVEIWLAGQPGRSAAARQPEATAPRKAAEQGSDDAGRRIEQSIAQAVAQSEADPYRPLGPGDQVRAVQRILLDRLQGN